MGGMGVVYRAKDTNLGRDVAIKVLPDAFVSDPERTARFRREATTLASLNHPNIGGIYGLQEGDGVVALVLEFIDGPTLADRLAADPFRSTRRCRSRADRRRALDSRAGSSIVI